MGEINDSDLMDAYVAGDAAAFDVLFARYARRAHAYFLKRTRSRERAGDLSQELFLRVHRFRDRFDSHRAFSPWFFRIAHRVWLDDLRRLRRDAVLEPSREDEPSEVGRCERLVAARQEARRFLDELTSEQARVFIWSKVGGAEYGEIAGRLGKSEAAARQIGSRAMRRLRWMAEAS